MLNLEDFMNIRDLKQQGWSVSAIAEQLNQSPAAILRKASRLCLVIRREAQGK